MAQSGSLGAALALGVTVLLAVTSRWWVKWNAVWVAPAVAGSFALGFFILLALSHFRGVDAVGVLSGGRFYVWMAAAKMALHHPLAGVGLGRFFAAFPAFCPPSYAYDPQIHAHNVFLHLMAEAGIPLAVCFFWVLHSTFRRVKLTEGNSGFRFALLLGATGGLLHNLVDYNFFVAPIALLFWGFLGTAVAGPREEPAERSA